MVHKLESNVVLNHTPSSFWMVTMAESGVMVTTPTVLAVVGMTRSAVKVSFNSTMSSSLTDTKTVTLLIPAGNSTAIVPPL